MCDDLLSQAPPKDFQVWTNFEAESPINKRWMIHVQHQSRFINNATQYGYSYFDAGGLFRISRNLRFTFNYIFADKKFNINQFHRLTVPYSDHFGIVADMSF